MVCSRDMSTSPGLFKATYATMGNAFICDPWTGPGVKRDVLRYTVNQSGFMNYHSSIHSILSTLMIHQVSKLTLMQYTVKYH